MNRSESDNGEIWDTHVHPIRSFATAESLRKEMESAGVSRAVLLALDLDPDILDSKALKEQILRDFLEYSLFLDPFRLLNTMKTILRLGNTPNELVADLVSQHPDQFIGFGSVNPAKDGRYVKAKLEEIAQLGLQGIKLISTLQFFNPRKNKNLKTIFKFAQRKDWPILIHLGKDPGPWEIHTLQCVQNSHPRNWKKIVKKFSNNKIIFAHLGGYGTLDDETWLDEVLRMALKNPNIYLDTSAVPNYLEIDAIVDSIRETCGFERILFGTDTPVVLGTSMEHSRSVIERNPLLTEEEKRLIFSENARRLFQTDASSR
ncbi:MAG: amidohydrolase family protein [Candidatus Hodarchaeales archaeon]|jgi:predicted TIM-barrel fold metal-dependent hydrolase